jgi:hypothetical protein
LKLSHHTSADSARPQEFPWPSDSDRRFYEEDEAEESFLIEIEEIEDADDEDYSDDGSARQ